jgi:hypothetical protein
MKKDTASHGDKSHLTASTTPVCLRPCALIGGIQGLVNWPEAMQS